ESPKSRPPAPHPSDLRGYCGPQLRHDRDGTVRDVDGGLSEPVIGLAVDQHYTRVRSTSEVESGPRCAGHVAVSGLDGPARGHREDAAVEDAAFELDRPERADDTDQLTLSEYGVEGHVRELPNFAPKEVDSLAAGALEHIQAEKGDSLS